MQRPSIMPKKFSTKLVFMTLLAGLIPIVIFSLLLNVFGSRFSNATHRAFQQEQEVLVVLGEAVLRQMAENHTRQKALDVAQQLDLYIAAHPEKTIKDLQEDPKFRALAIQPIGESGHTYLVNSSTATCCVHRNPRIENLDLQSMSNKMPEFWSIIKASLGGEQSCGYYQWHESDGKILNKFMHIVPIHEAPADGVPMVVVTAISIDEFTRPIFANEDIFEGPSLHLMATVNELIRSFQKIGFVSMSLGVALVLAMAYWIGIYFSRAITQLREATSEVNRGNFDIHLAPTMSGDVGKLIQDFNKMVAQLGKTTVSKERLELSERELKETNSKLQQEIAERRVIENEFKRARDYLENVFANSPDAIGIVDEHGRFVKCNRMAAQLYGFDYEELEGKSGFELYADPDELEKMLKMLRRDGSVSLHEIIMKRKDETTFPAELSISLLKNSENRNIGSVSVARDLTEIKQTLAAVEEKNEQLQQEMAERKQIEEELRQSEERYRTVLESNPDPVVLYDIEGKVTYFNPAFTDVFGWTLEERLGKKMDLFVPQENWPETEMMI
ncbi:MAG: PAS domain S-box protein, partial [Syntrophobacterales bacterium]